MKTTQATVNLVLNEQRKNKDGLCPVVLRIFWKGRKDRQTDIYIPKSQWLVKEASSLGKKRTGGVITTAPALFYTHMNIFQFNERKKEIKMTSNIR